MKYSFISEEIFPFQCIFVFPSRIRKCRTVFFLMFAIFCLPAMHAGAQNALRGIMNDVELPGRNIFHLRGSNMLAFTDNYVVNFYDTTDLTPLGTIRINFKAYYPFTQVRDIFYDRFNDLIILWVRNQLDYLQFTFGQSRYLVYDAKSFTQRSYHNPLYSLFSTRFSPAGLGNLDFSELNFLHVTDSCLYYQSDSNRINKIDRSGISLFRRMEKSCSDYVILNNVIYGADLRRKKIWKFTHSGAEIQSEIQDANGFRFLRDLSSETDIGFLDRNRLFSILHGKTQKQTNDSSLVFNMTSVSASRTFGLIANFQNQVPQPVLVNHGSANFLRAPAVRRISGLTVKGDGRTLSISDPFGLNYHLDMDTLGGYGFPLNDLDPDFKLRIRKFMVHFKPNFTDGTKSFKVIGSAGILLKGTLTRGKNLVDFSNDAGFFLVEDQLNANFLVYRTQEQGGISLVLTVPYRTLAQHDYSINEGIKKYFSADSRFVEIDSVFSRFPNRGIVVTKHRLYSLKTFRLVKVVETINYQDEYAFGNLVSTFSDSNNYYYAMSRKINDESGYILRYNLDNMRHDSVLLYELGQCNYLKGFSEYRKQTTFAILYSKSLEGFNTKILDISAFSASAIKVVLSESSVFDYWVRFIRTSTRDYLYDAGKILAFRRSEEGKNPICIRLFSDPVLSKNYPVFTCITPGGFFYFDRMHDPRSFYFSDGNKNLSRGETAEAFNQPDSIWKYYWGNNTSFKARSLLLEEIKNKLSVSRTHSRLRGLNVSILHVHPDKNKIHLKMEFHSTEKIERFIFINNKSDTVYKVLPAGRSNLANPLQITIPSGESFNQIEIFAVSGGNIYYHDTYNFRNKTVNNQINAWCLVIAAGDYKNLKPLMPSIYDGRLIIKSATNLFRARDYKIQPADTLFDHEFTRQNFDQVIDRYRKKMKKQDILLVYYSGHGFRDKDGRFCLPFTNYTGASTDDFLLSSHVISSIRELPAIKKLLLVDACYSGSAVDELVGNSNGYEKTYFDYLMKFGHSQYTDNSLIIFASTDRDEQGAALLKMEPNPLGLAVAMDRSISYFGSAIPEFHVGFFLDNLRVMYENLVGKKFRSQSSYSRFGFSWSL
jgi:hypothetical protein